jgi:7,8-dihydroneopterin aldolase/epimerase/oxygenase
MSDSIFLHDLNVDCIIGANPPERHRTQRLVLQVELKLNVHSAASLDRLELTVDYESVSSQILFLLHLGQFRLLETACQVLCRTLLLAPCEGERRAAIEAVKIRVDKPEGLMGQATPGVEIVRRCEDVSFAVRQMPYGQMYVVHETPGLGIYRKCLAPGAIVPVHLHRAHQEAEMIISDGLSLQDGIGAMGSIRLWPFGCPHGYRNLTQATQSVLCISRPLAGSDDEVPVEGLAAPVRALTSRDLDAQHMAEAWAWTA